MLQVENVTRNTILVEQGEAATTFWRKFRGLMGVRTLPPGAGLLLPQCNQIHTHFMRFPLDVLYLDSQQRIVAIDPALPPWRIGRKQPHAVAVLELPSGAVARTECQVGDQLVAIDTTASDDVGNYGAAGTLDCRGTDSAQEGNNDKLSWLGMIDPTSPVITFEHRLSTSADEAQAIPEAEAGAGYLTEPVGEEAAEVEAVNQSFVPLWARGKLSWVGCMSLQEDQPIDGGHQHYAAADVTDGDR